MTRLWLIGGGAFLGILLIVSLVLALTQKEDQIDYYATQIRRRRRWIYCAVTLYSSPIASFICLA